MAFDSDVLRLQIGDRWAWCQVLRDVVFTGPPSGPGTMASTSSSRAAPRSAQACMLCYGTLFVACAAPMASGLPFMMAAPAIGSAAAQSCLGREQCVLMRLHVSCTTYRLSAQRWAAELDFLGCFLVAYWR